MRVGSVRTEAGLEYSDDAVALLGRPPLGSLASGSAASIG
jgi:hypothetical protein